MMKLSLNKVLKTFSNYIQIQLKLESLTLEPALNFFQINDISSDFMLFFKRSVSLAILRCHVINVLVFIGCI